MSDALIQTRVPAGIYKWIDLQAKKSGLSIAAWLRNHFVEEVTRMRIEAWPVDLKNSSTHRQLEHPVFFLERSREFSATERAFWLYHGPLEGNPGEAVSASWWAGYGSPSRELGMLVKGSNTPWEVIGSLFDETTQRLEITLRMR